MEGRSVLFKRFADVDSIDIELDMEDPDAFIGAVHLMSPSLGGINLEDVRALEFVMIDSRLKNLLDIPVFHDDQYSTAVTCAAVLVKSLMINKKKIEDVPIMLNGAGAAGISCAELLKAMGARAGNSVLCDIKGVVHRGRAKGMNQ